MNVHFLIKTILLLPGFSCVEQPLFSTPIYVKQNSGTLKHFNYNQKLITF